MKQLSAIILALVLAVGLCACGCTRRDDPMPSEKPVTTPTTTPPTTPTTTPPTTMPDIPEPETNIPDPTVDSNSTGKDPQDSDTQNMPGSNSDGEMSRSRARRKP